MVSRKINGSVTGREGCMAWIFQAERTTREKVLYHHTSQLFLLTTPRTLVSTIHLSNNNVLSHETSSIIVLNYLSPLLPNFS